MSIAPSDSTPRRRRTLGEFLRKYFLYGQKTTEEFVADDSEPAPFDLFLQKHKKIVCMLAPPAVVYVFYWILATEYGFYKLFPLRYEMCLVMAFASFVGGATAEGSAVIAYPVMTLLLHIDPTIARDFAVMIQTIGMNSAGLSTILMGVLVERYSLAFCTIGGAIGVVISLEFIEPNLTAAYKKMIFVSVFFAFACALYMLNREKKRVTFDKIQNFDFTKAVILICVGVVGGLFSGIGGSGVCIFSFSILTLFFRINEKVATPTTVTLGGLNCAIAFFWRNHKMHKILPLAWEYWAVCVPVSSVAGPLGALLSSHVHRQTLAVAIYFLETVSLIGAAIIVKPDLTLSLVCAGLIVASCLFYVTLAKLGERFTLQYETKKKNAVQHLPVVATNGHS